MKPTIFLALILTALCGYLYFVELPAREAKKSAEAKKSTLFSFAESDIVELMITQSGQAVGQAISLVQILGHKETPWKIAEPIDAVADSGIASSFAGLLANLKIVRMVDAHPEGLMPFGLNPPLYSVRMLLKGLDSDLLEVGADGLSDNTVYARVGNAVYLIDGAIKTYLAKSLTEWRRQELFQFAVSDITAIRMEGRGENIALTKKGEAWFMNADNADPDRVAGFLGVLSSLRGEEFIDQDKAEKRSALGTPFLRINISEGKILYEGAFYAVESDPAFIYAVTTPNAPIYKISEKRFEEIHKPAAYFKKDIPSKIPQ